MRLWRLAGKKKKKKKKQEHVKSSRKPASCKTSFSFWKLLRKMSSIKHSEHLIIKVIQMEFLGLSELQPDSLNEAFNTDGGLLCLETQNGLHEISLGSFIKWTDTKCSKHPYLLTSLFKMLNLFFYITHSIRSSQSSCSWLMQISDPSVFSKRFLWLLISRCFHRTRVNRRPFFFWNPTPGVQVSHRSVPGLQIL